MKNIKKALLILTVCILPCVAIATPPDPGDGPEPTPIDGGASVLVAAAVAYGVRSVRRKKAANDKADC